MARGDKGRVDEPQYIAPGSEIRVGIDRAVEAGDYTSKVVMEFKDGTATILSVETSKEPRP